MGNTDTCPPTRRTPLPLLHGLQLSHTMLLPQLPECCVSDSSQLLLPSLLLNKSDTRVPLQLFSQEAWPFVVFMAGREVAYE